MDKNSTHLTVEQAAAYLIVSEASVRDWVFKNQIPFEKRGEQIFFDLETLRVWTDEKFAEKRKSIFPQPIRIEDVLVQDRILILDTTNKRIALETLIKSMEATAEITNRYEFGSEIFRREELMSTGIGLGVAIPHVRLDSIKNLIMSIGICRENIKDYESIDDKPVRIIIMIAASKNQHQQYLRILALMSHLLKNQQFYNALLGAQNGQTAFNLLIRHYEYVS